MNSDPMPALASAGLSACLHCAPSSDLVNLPSGQDGMSPEPPSEATTSVPCLLQSVPSLQPSVPCLQQCAMPLAVCAMPQQSVPCPQSTTNHPGCALLMNQDGAGGWTEHATQLCVKGRCTTGITVGPTHPSTNPGVASLLCCLVHCHGCVVPILPWLFVLIRHLGPHC